MTVDLLKSGDQVVESEGDPVLLISRPMNKAIGEMTLDIEDRPEGAHVVLRRIGNVESQPGGDEMDTPFERVAATNELQPGEMKVVQVQGEEVCLVNLAGEFYAISDDCTHAGGPLHVGELEEEEVECPLHGSRFNVKTGEPTEPPASIGVKVFEVRVEGEDILVKPR